jgi:hypothetical protein
VTSVKSTTVTSIIPTTATYVTTMTQSGTTETSTVTSVKSTTVTNVVPTTATHVIAITQPGTTVISTIFVFPPPPPLITVSCDHPSPVVGVRIKCEVEVEPTSGIAPTGRATWSTASSGKFSSSAGTSASCKLAKHISFSVCSVLFTPTAAGSPVVLTVNYAGDSSNFRSAGTYNLTVLPKATKTMISCSPRSVVAGSTTNITCKAKVTGYSPTGTTSWSQTGTGSVSIVSTTYTLTKGTCSVKMTGSISGSVIITASYSGDSNNQGSSSTATLTIK